MGPLARFAVDLAGQPQQPVHHADIADMREHLLGQDLVWVWGGSEPGRRPLFQSLVGDGTCPLATPPMTARVFCTKAQTSSRRSANGTTLVSSASRRLRTSQPPMSGSRSAGCADRSTSCLAHRWATNSVAAPFSAAQLHQSRSRISHRMLELSISAVLLDVDGPGCTVRFRTPATLRAKDAIAADEKRGNHIAGTPVEEQPAIAVLFSPPGSPMVRISDELSNPQPAGGRRAVA